MVVGFHAGLPMPGGFVGVDVFFVISGFVITAMLLREAQRSGQIRLGTFYVRRFKRLIPALATVVGLTLIVSLFLISPIKGQEETAKTGLGAMLFAANIMLARIGGGYFATAAELNPLLHTWSLSVEEQFYFILPVSFALGLLVAKRVGHLRGVLISIVVFMGAVSFAVMAAGVNGIEIPLVPRWLLGFYAASTRTWEFAAGALLALGWSRLSTLRVSRRSGFVLAATGTAMLAASIWLIDSATPWPSHWTLLPVLGTVLLISAGLGEGTVFTRVLESRAMVAIGDRSYSIYLWHWPFIVFAHILWSPSPWILTTAALISLVPAYASYRWIEQPLRTHKAHRGFPLVRFVSITTVPALLLSGVLFVSAQTNVGNSTLNAFDAQLEPHHLAKAKGCFANGWESPWLCSWNNAEDGPPIYLVGDSNADQFSEALLASSTTLSRPFVGVTHHGCPYPDIRPRSFDAEEPTCRAFAENAGVFLNTEAEPGIVVLSSSWRQYLFDDTRKEGPRTGASRAETLRSLELSLTQAVNELQESGHTVVIVQTIPHWIFSQRPLSWVSCSITRLALDGCRQTMTFNELPEAHRLIADVITTVGAETGAYVFDVTDEVCPKSTCTTVREDGLLPYRDLNHVTVKQSEELGPVFTQEITKALESSQR